MKNELTAVIAAHRKYERAMAKTELARLARNEAILAALPAAGSTRIAQALGISEGMVRKIAKAEEAGTS